ncbi:MAG: 3-hydroxyacyl-CoA dehydrogenase family protein [Thermomicrobiales bacterium]|nr:3-hydroxyacyl-CoA dehydrogenase family protein [Thermomicrobiales bacterium]
MEADTEATETRSIERVAMIGAGTMGRQIAALVARSGRPVRLFDTAPEMLTAAPQRIREETLTQPGLDRYAHHRFRLEPPADVDAMIARIALADSLADAVVDADLVIEAAPEVLELKRDLFADLSLLAPAAILATNSSSMPSSLIASAVGDPGRLLNMHFFAPVWFRAMVELMSCGQTRPEVMASAEAFGASLGIVVAVVRGESKGFIINRVWRAVKREALRVVDEGHADPEDVDRLWMLFFGTPSGPFGIMDMVGLDVVADIETSYQQVATDPADKPSATLREMVRRGALGEKSGEGFYHHPNPEYSNPRWLAGEADEPNERGA